MEARTLEAVKIVEHAANLNWEFDDTADVLYLSSGAPAPSLGVDIGDGLILRYDAGTGEVTGITIVGLKGRLAQRLANEHQPQE